MTKPTGKLLFAYNTITNLNERVAELEEELMYAIELLEDSGVDYEEIRTAYLIDEVIECTL